MAQCSRCGKTGGMFDVKMYNLPNKQDKVLCNACYQEVIRSGEYFNQSTQRPVPQQPQMRCPGCNNPVNSDFKMCPYCGVQITAAQPQQPAQKITAKCPECGGEISAEFKVCPFCGKKVEQVAKKKGNGKFCAECGAEIKEGQKFCGGCGAKTE